MPDLPSDLRLILVHKHKTSARVRFLRFGHGMCAFEPLPTLSVVEEEGEGEPEVAYHPSAWLRAAEERLGLASGCLKPEPAFHATVQTPSGPVTIHLVEVTTMDPPFAEAEAMAARFVAITEARGCSGVELELLRRAYTAVLG